MGFIQNLFEDKLKIKFVKNNNEFSGVPITSDKEDITYKQINDIGSSSLLDGEAIATFRRLSSNRQEKYTSYENMLTDATIAAAMEMYADDATQYDPKKGKIIWVEAADPDIAKAANRLIDVLQINEKAWKHIYSLCTYGDLYLRIYREGDTADYEDILNVQPGVIRTKVQDTSRPMEEYIEYVEDPSTIYDLQIKDKTSGFVRMHTTNTNTQNANSYIHNSIGVHQVSINNVDFYDRRSFVHISLAESISRNPEYLAISDPENNSTTVYKVKSGKSILADAYEAAQTVKLLEDSMLLSRLTKSALIRLLQIEVGDMPKPEVENLLRRVKNMIEQKIALNKNNGEARSYNSPGPMENIIYFPTKEGKGAITLNNLGGDVNVKDIADIEYFNNKLLSALKTPKQFLNYDSPEGLGNGTSLTKISSRYAHTIMRIQSAYKAGIATLLNLFFLDKGLEYINKFTVKMVSPATIEDIERDEQMSNRINQVSDILNLISEVVDDQGKIDTLVHLLSEYLNLSEIAGIIKDHNILESTGSNDIEFDDIGGDRGDTYNNFGSSSDNFDMEDNFSVSEPDMNVSPEPEISPEPDVTPET